MDGIELRGNAQLVLSGGGTCNVLESDTSYEERKQNHGAPMDIWRLDFSVRNGSGRWLDHLIARYEIESEWPECTNWDGPDTGASPQIVEWANSNGHIQESGRNVVAPGRTLTATHVFIVLRGDPQPRFSNWSMDFDFAAAPPPPGFGPASATQQTVPDGVSTGRADREAGAVSQLPPEIQMDLNLRKAEQAVRDGDTGTAREAMERVASLQASHGPVLGLEDHYRQARAWAAVGEPEQAVEEAVLYLQAGGREAEHYTEALDLINRDGTAMPAVAAGTAAAARVQAGATPVPPPQPACAGPKDAAECWIKLTNHPGCYVWNDGYTPDEPVSWSGACLDGKASGRGAVTGTPVRFAEFPCRSEVGCPPYESRGAYRRGKKQGRWIERDAANLVSEGPYLDGKRHGHWVDRFSAGDVSQGPYVNGEMHGEWVWQDTDGSGARTQWVNGEEKGTTWFGR